MIHSRRYRLRNDRSSIAQAVVRMTVRAKVDASPVKSPCVAKHPKNQAVHPSASKIGAARLLFTFSVESRLSVRSTYAA